MFWHFEQQNFKISKIALIYFLAIVKAVCMQNFNSPTFKTVEGIGGKRWMD